VKETMKKLTSTVSQLQKSTGINTAAATWVDDDIIGDYTRITPPENWRELIVEADANTPDMTTATVIGDADDWQWWELRVENSDGFLTGEEWIVAQYAEDSTAEEICYEVDAAMLGSEFKGDNNSLTAFVAILREFAPDWTITAIIDSYNGADNNVPEEVEYEIDQAFSSALDQHSEQYPNDWN